MSETKNHIGLFTVSGCLKHEAMMAFLSQTLHKSDQDSVIEHLEKCELCKEALEGLQGLPPQKIKLSVASLHKNLHHKALEHQKAINRKPSKQLNRNFPWMSVAASIILFIGVFYYFKFYILKKDNVDKQLTMESPQTGLIQSAVIDTNSKQLLAVGGIRNEPIQAQAKAKRLQKVVHEQNPTETSLQVVENDDEVVSAYDPVLSERRVYQGTTQAEEVKAEEEIFVVVESMPVFPGGESALMIYLSQHLQYPDTIAKELLQTTAYVKFIVDTSGKAKNPVILRSISPNFDKQMLKIIEEMPLWQPATTRGKKVAVQMILPLKLEHTK